MKEIEDPLMQKIRYSDKLLDELAKDGKDLKNFRIEIYAYRHIDAMKELSLRNITMMALVASCFIQIGAQLFALVVVASTVSAAPPRSFAMLQGEYGYNSSAFWSTLPTITFALFLIALVANWKTRRLKLLLLALTLFIGGGLVAGLFLEPVFDEMKAMGFRDEIDPMLQSRAATWYTLDWAVWGTGLVAGLTLLLALIRPVTTPTAASSPKA